MKHPPIAICLTSVLLVLGLLSSSRAAADTKDLRPPALRDVALEPNIGQRLPLELDVRDSNGRAAPFGEFFDAERPVLLTLAYIDCSMLCDLVIHGIADVVGRMDLVAGRDYRLVTVAIDPSESPQEQQKRQRSLLRAISRDTDDAAWVYLHGSKATVDKLASALGFRYTWDPRTKQYAHPAVAFVVTPDGRVSRDFPGVRFDPESMSDALRKAGRGGLASRVAQAVVSCFRFDPALRAQRERIQTFFRIGAGSVLAALCCLVGGLALWRWRRG